MKQLARYITLLFFFISIESNIQAQKEELVLYKPLRGQWKFSIGDRKEWKAINFNDFSWENIYVPGAWEEQGFGGYDGYAWYRKEFNLPADASNLDLWLDLGYIDDVDECFINGKRIGQTGTFPPHHKTAYKAHRFYHLNSDYLNYGGKNVIAVRVYDSYNEGGIISGKIGIWKNAYPLIPDYSLAGTWKFITGDRNHYKDINLNESDWNTITVPAAWEDQGYEYYDGIAWYRKTFELPATLNNEHLVLLMGKIDDVDEVYVNGVMIGNTGLIDPFNFIYPKAYDKLRGYYIPLEIIQNSKTLTIAVRVYDARLSGGIYQGPVGIVTQEKYIDYWRQQRGSR